MREAWSFADAGQVFDQKVPASRAGNAEARVPDLAAPCRE